MNVVMPLIKTAEERREEFMAAHRTVPAPEKLVVDMGGGAGIVKYQPGDPVPLEEAVRLGWATPSYMPPEPEMDRASNRGRRIRSADRGQPQSE